MTKLTNFNCDKTKNKTTYLCDSSDSMTAVTVVTVVTEVTVGTKKTCFQ